MPDFEIDKSRVLAFFDGASNNGVYGGGIALYSLDFHFVLLKLGHGKGTNQRVELITLWGRMKYIVQAYILQLQIFGDSRVIIGWIEDISKLQIAQLSHWCRKTQCNTPMVLLLFSCLEKYFYYVMSYETQKLR